MKYKLFIILWVIIIFILSSLSGNELDKVPKINIPHFDKIVHFGMYSILQFLFILFYSKTNPKISVKTYIAYTSVFSVSYSILMEILQSIIFEKRSGDFLDVLANTIGVLTVLLFYRFNILKKLRLI